MTTNNQLVNNPRIKKSRSIKRPALQKILKKRVFVLKYLPARQKSQTPLYEKLFDYVYQQKKK